VRAAPIRDAGGNITKWVGMNLDITARKQAEQRLRQSEERFSKAFSASPSGLVISRESDGMVREANQAILELLGLRSEDLIGKSSRELGWLDDPAREKALRLFHEQGRLRDYEMAVRTRSGALRTVLLSLEAIEAGGERSLLTIVRDITESRKMEEALREADRRKDEFLATLAHELRNPLAPICNAVQLMNLRGEPDPTLQAARAIIERQIRHMARLIDDLLDVSRISRGKIELRKERVALAAVFEQAIETSRPHLGHELMVSLPSEPIHLDADPVRLAEVFSNLLNNAAKYTEKGGRIRLTAERDRDSVVVKVSDTGIGIAAGHLSRIFEMFSQAAPALDRTHGGLGIGLAIARGLVEMHGGSIEAHSEGLDKGSEFVVRLPLPATTPAAPLTREHARDKRISARTILVVEDNRDAAQSLAMLLRLDGNQVELAEDGMEAVHKAEACRPEAILLDIGLPKMNGYDACREIRRKPWGKDIALIALTGWGQEEDRRKAMEAGFDAHLVKPVQYAAMMDVLDSLLKAG
jgi:PAS domain S-box-containing protein